MQIRGQMIGSRPRLAWILVTASLFGARTTDAQGQEPWPLRSLPYQLAEERSFDASLNFRPETELLGLPPLEAQVLPDGVREVRLWVVGPGPTIPQTLLRLTVVESVVDGETVLWWNQSEEPFTDPSSSDWFEHPIAEYQGREACRSSQTADWLQVSVRDGIRTESQGWVVACHFRTAKDSAGWAAILGELDGLHADDLGSNESVRTLPDGTVLVSRDGTGLQGEVLAGSDYHFFEWTNPATRSEPGADRADRIVSLVLAEEQALTNAIFSLAR